MYSEVVGFLELPLDGRFEKSPDDKFLILKEDARIVDIIALSDLINTPDQALNILKYAIDLAYSLGAKMLVSPSPKVCAWLAHVEAEKYSNSQGLSPLEQKRNIALTHQFNEISDRFAKGQIPQPIYKPTNNRILAYKVKGDQGHTYSVDAGATHCTCAAGMKNQECWHIRMVDIYLKAIEYERSG